MAILGIGYDLYQGGKHDYTDLIVALKRFPSWCHALESQWFIRTRTDWSAENVYNFLRKYMDPKDKLVIATVAEGEAWLTYGVSQEVANWFREQVAA